MIFDLKNPNYIPIFKARMDRLEELRATPGAWDVLKAHYKTHPWQLIIDWGVTFDPRGKGIVPFILFPKQVEWCQFIYRKWKASEDGLTDKSRDMGVSWLAVSFSAALCVTNPGLVIGFGSKTEDDVDKNGDPDSLFWKLRTFVENLPRELRGGFDGTKRTTAHMLVRFPEMDSTIKGDAGDNIGRGGRASIYFVDEAAHVPRPAAVDAALSQTTPCRQDISTPRGMANSFAAKRWGGMIETFTLFWRDDPRKDDDWYAAQVRRLDTVTLAQEVDLDYTASVEGVLIPSAWVQAAIGADEKLGLTPSGARLAALDVADEGGDLNAFCGAHGIFVEVMEEWSGKGSDLLYTASKAFGFADEHGYDEFSYDADGVGAGIKGMSRGINEQRRHEGLQAIKVVTFRGSAAVLHPEAQDIKGRKNKDVFANLKAQSWWRLRVRFELTHRAVLQLTEPSPNYVEPDPDDLIVLPRSLKNLSKLTTELSQPTYTINATGKFVVDKAPEGVKSPNLGDSLMMRFGAVRRPMVVGTDAVSRFSRPVVTTVSRGIRPAGVLGGGVSTAALARFRRTS